MVTWASLDFQPYFTATASNVGYGWWSHDVGGHFFGYKDDELAVRWTQFGVFSPITRLHSSDSPFNTREPWRFGERAQRIMTAFLRLRHRLVPYLHTMNRRAHRDGEPLVQPMYYDHPDDDDAYRVPNQYCFGDRLLVAPITTPADRATGLGAVRAWLPPGRWTDVFTGLVYRGGTTILLHRDLDTIPVLAPAGAILPLARGPRLGTANPDALELRVYAGADGEFTLAEDRDDGRWALTRFTLTGDELRIHPVDGERGSVPGDPPLRRGAVRVHRRHRRRGRRDRAADRPRPGARQRGHVAGGGRGRGRGAPAGRRHHSGREPGRRRARVRPAGRRPDRAGHQGGRAPGRDTAHDPARAVAALAALDLPQPLFTAVVELLLA